MNARDRIVEEFDRLLELFINDQLDSCSPAEQAVYWLVATRCEIDIDGFASVYEQLLDQQKFEILINGLQQIGKRDLAHEFAKGVEILAAEGFYGTMNWGLVSDEDKRKIDEIGERVGASLWDLDELLVRLLDNRHQGQ